MNSLLGPFLRSRLVLTKNWEHRLIWRRLYMTAGGASRVPVWRPGSPVPDVVRTDVLQYGCEHVLDPGVSRQGMFWCAEAAAWTVYGRRLEDASRVSALLAGLLGTASPVSPSLYPWAGTARSASHHAELPARWRAARVGREGHSYAASGDSRGRQRQRGGEARCA